ncbi:hypothetical protein [Roseateles oligotrophus]|uniref:Phasin family protein n=1 Tax=Roseateles oligotrophus TaxID=1769250 RepID=A0ABT2YLF8_9BURK|nr:hypothetical protein [Roseateles oligotrophus]MCV2370881.1 hypothetical protein [Roseateles oligotrophus]
MNHQTLSTVTLEAIDNYARAASLTVKAYRAGSSRLLNGVNDGLQAQVYSRSVKLAPNLTGALTQLRDSLSEIIDGGVGKLTTGSERVIKVGSSKARVGVARMAGFAAAAQNPLLARGLTTAARLSMPGARAARALSAGLVEGVGRLSLLAGVPPTKVKRAAVKAKPAVSATAAVETVKKTAVRAKRQVLAQVEAQIDAAPVKVAAVKRRARKVVAAA